MKIEITMQDYVTIETAMELFLIERKAENPTHDYIKHLTDALERFRDAHWDAIIEDAHNKV